MPSPDFIVAGASRSGTTTLCHYLNEHDDIFLAERDQGAELHFFENDGEFDRGITYYESHFDTAPEGQVLGEKTPTYFYKGISWTSSAPSDYTWRPDDDAPKRIHDHYPDVKLIFTLRNPATRAYSQFWKNYRQGRETASSFRDAIEAELDGERRHQEDRHCWIYLNSYSTHLRRWLEFFDRDQVKVLVFEEWIEDSDPVLADVCRFLDVEPPAEWNRSGDVKNVGGLPRILTINRLYQRYVSPTSLGTLLRKTRVTHLADQLNSTSGYPEMDEDDWKLMERTLADEIDATEKLLDRDLDIWRAEIKKRY